MTNDKGQETRDKIQDTRDKGQMISAKPRTKEDLGTDKTTEP